MNFIIAYSQYDLKVSLWAMHGSGCSSFRDLAVFGFKTIDPGNKKVD